MKTSAILYLQIWTWFRTLHLHLCRNPMSTCNCSLKLQVLAHRMPWKTGGHQDTKRHWEATAPLGGPRVRGMYAVSTRNWARMTSSQKVAGGGTSSCKPPNFNLFKSVVRFSCLCIQSLQAHNACKTQYKHWGQTIPRPPLWYPDVAKMHVKHNTNIELRQSLGLTYGTLMSLKCV